MSEPIAIIGLGIAFPGAHSPERFFDNLLRGRCFVRDVLGLNPEDRWFLQADRSAVNTTYAAIGALVDDPVFDAPLFRIPPAVARRMSRAQKLALICAREALHDAGLLGLPDVQREKTSVIMAAIGAGDIQEDLYAAVIERRTIERLRQLAGEAGLESGTARLLDSYASRFPVCEMNEDSLPGASPNLVAGRIASVFDLHGINTVLDAACASSLLALHLAAQSLQSRESDLVLAGGVDTWVDIGAFIQFAKITALAERGCFPFDERAEGLVIGEGCGVVALKRLDDAQRDGHRIYAVLRGTGASSDGRATGITMPTVNGQLMAMRRAYAAAGRSPRDLNYMECHGTGTRVGDPIELQSVDTLLREAGRDPADPLPIGSVKASIGHLRTAAGMAGLCNAIKVIQHRIIPGQVNFETPTNAFDWHQSVVRVPRQAELLEDEEIMTAVSGFGFGGTNGHAVLTSPPTAYRRIQNERYREREKIQNPSVRGDTAWLFPGQGSQYPGMLAALSETGPGKELLSRADAIVEELCGEKLSTLIYPERGAPDADARLRRTEFAQPAILTISTILARLLTARQVPCAMMIGHSLGEYSAMVAAGAIPFEDAIRAVTVRGRSMSCLPDGAQPGVMAYLSGEPDAIEQLMRGREGIYPANINSYRQLVVAGSAAAIDALIKDALLAGLRADRLNVDRGFHSPLVAHSAGPVRAVLQNLSIRTPQVPVPANIAGQWYPFSESSVARPGGDERNRLIDMLVAQIDHPVDFVSQIERAYRAGIRRFIEVGPRRVLSGLVSEILEGKSIQVISLDIPESSPEERIDSLIDELKRPLHPCYARVSVPARTNSPSSRSAPALMDQASIEDAIRAVVASVSGYDAKTIRDDADFDRDLGLDSIKIVEVIARLRGTVIPPDHRGFRNLMSVQSIAAIARSYPGEASNQRTAAPFHCYLNAFTTVSADFTQNDRIDGWILDRDGSIADHQLKMAKVAVIRAVHDDDELLNRVIPGILQLCVRCAALSAGALPVRVAIITTGRTDAAAARTYRTLVGLVRSVQMELPSIRFSYHHLDGKPAESLLFRCLGDITVGRRCLVDATWQQDELQPLAGLPDDDTILSGITGHDVILVTGGARGIASVVVRDLLARTRARFVLIGRSRDSEPWFEAEGAGRIEYLCADVGDRRELEALDLASRPITMIMHAAGVTYLEPLARQGELQWRRVIGAKASGLDHLMSAVDRSRVRLIVNFSSVVAHFGNLAQADYAAANGYLDGYTCAGIPVLSIGWTAWDDVGMAVRGATRHVLDASGIQRLPAQEGARYLRRILSWWFSQGDRQVGAIVEVFGELGDGWARQADAVQSADQELPSGIRASLIGNDEDIVTINPRGTSIPVFMICGIFGYGYRLQLVARELDRSVPVHILQPPGMNWNTAGCAGFGEMAAWYADRIHTLRPEGPIGLAGTSFGGNMVFEIACLLQARGRTVSFLAMIDTMPFDEDPLEYEALSKNIDALRSTSADPIELGGMLVARQQLAALREHAPAAIFNGVISFALATGFGYPARSDRRFDWERFAAEGMCVVPVSGVHGGFALKPTRQEVARFIEALSTGKDPGTRTVHDFVSGSGSQCIITNNHGRHIPLADGRSLPLQRKKDADGAIDAVKMYHSRIWLSGRVSHPSLEAGTCRVHLYLNDRFLHGCLVDRCKGESDDGRAFSRGFQMVADLYRCRPADGDVIRVIALFPDEAIELDAWRWPLKTDASSRADTLAARMIARARKLLGD